MSDCVSATVSEFGTLAFDEIGKVGWLHWDNFNIRGEFTPVDIEDDLLNPSRYIESEEDCSEEISRIASRINGRKRVRNFTDSMGYMLAYLANVCKDVQQENVKLDYAPSGTITYTYVLDEKISGAAVGLMQSYLETIKQAKMLASLLKEKNEEWWCENAEE